uniref:Protein E7 n=1 Tax=Human papillomavirus type 213 TaxID=2060137 RepID=A0A2H4V8D3_9PAPI|nr:E7 protein [Human papillomavirus type 213]CAD1814379.1 E7 protein [Human papillomavirus type 213]
MRGNNPTINDIELHLEELVLPVNLLANESLSLDDQPEEEQQQYYRVDSLCGNCNTRVRLVVLANNAAIRELQQLLFASLSIVCSRCARDPGLHDGRP